MYISLEDKGHIKEILLNWPHKEARVIVVTDGGRILGLGDLGVNGMGIPIGKLSLYTACAGIDPTKCLPISIDVGTNNQNLLNDDFYLGNQHQRIEGTAYYELMDEFIQAVKEVFPKAIIQLEDFATEHAFTLLKKYRMNSRIFDDDIQGTASVALAGLLSALKIKKSKLKDEKVLFLGAGEAGIGIGEIIVAAAIEAGIPEEKARLQNWFIDSKGLVCSERKDLAAHKVAFAHNHPFKKGLREIIKTLKPTALIGVSGQGGKFTKEVIELMSEINERPVIFALSNPTSKSECTAEQAYRWSKGKAIFASGSPFPPVEYEGRTIIPGQGNNVYIFPGIGLGLAYSHARLVTDSMFLEAAKVLSDMVPEEELQKGNVYPPLEQIRDVSAAIAAAVARIACEEGLSGKQLPENLVEHIKTLMYQPDYSEYR